jgi:hypothetical protein
MSRGGRLLGVVATGVAAVCALVVFGERSEGTVVGKASPGAEGSLCRSGNTLTGPLAAGIWGACSVPACWRLVVRGADGTTSEPCVSREEYDRTQPGAFWHGRTDR